MHHKDRDNDLSGQRGETPEVNSLLADRYLNNSSSGDLLRFLEFSINISADMMLFFTKDLRLCYANAAVSRQLGCSTDKLLSMIVNPLDPGITPEKWEGLWEQAKKNGHIERTSMLKTRDGRLVPAHVLVYWFTFHGNEYLCCFIRDLDDCKKVKYDLSEGQGLYQLLAETAEDSIYIIDRDLIIRYINRWGADYLGIASDDIIGKPLEKFFPPDVYSMMKNNISKVFSSGRSLLNDSFVMKKETERIYNAKLVPVIEQDQVSYVMGITRDITELKKAEKALLKSENDMIKAQKIAHIGNWEWDLTTNELLCSDEAYRIFGYLPREFKVTFQHVLSRVHPEDREYLENIIVESIAQQKAYHQAIFRVVWPDGTVRHVQSEAEIVSDAGGKMIKMFGVCHDITELQQANEQRSFLAAIVESSSDAIIGKTLEGTITSWNKGAERIYGYSAAEVLGSPVSILVPKDKPDEIPEILERIRKGELVDNFETTRIRKDGERIDISLTVSPIKNPHGDIVGASTIARDITRHKHVELALKKNEQYYRELIGLTQEGIWAIDDRGHTIYVNQYMAEMLGYAVEKMLRKQIFYFMDENGKKLAREHMAKRMLGVREIFDFEFIKKDGSRVYTIMNSAPIINEYGGYGGAVSFVTDITGRKMAEKALEDAKMRSDLYLDLMARDINSMNQAGKKYLELALKAPGLDENIRSIVLKSLSEFENSSILIENVRKLQKVKSTDVVLKNMDLSRVLADVQRHYARMPDRKIRINYTPIDHCQVLADEMLFELFLCLTDDVIKHSIKSPVINIDLKQISDDGRMYYSVVIEDRSLSIRGEAVNKTLHKRLPDMSNLKGVDIGLYLAKTLVENYKGEIRAQGRVKGSTAKGGSFTVLLPEAP